jgi:hypothetical protein
MTDRFEASGLVQAAGFKLIARLAQDIPTALALVEGGAMDRATRAMSHHRPNIDCQLYCCWAIIEMSGAEADAADLELLEGGSVAVVVDDHSTEPPNRDDVIDAVTESMKRHIDVADVQRYGCRALENIGARSEEQVRGLIPSCHSSVCSAT